MIPDDTTTKTVRRGALKASAAKRPREPQDRRPPSPSRPKRKKSAQRIEEWDEPQTFEWDGEEWTVVPSAATSLEFIAELEDERIVSALRLLLGRKQAARLVRGRSVDAVEPFFEAMGEALSSGNR